MTQIINGGVGAVKSQTLWVLPVTANGDAWNVPSGGSIGDVSGPASSIDRDIAIFDGTSGKTIRDGSVNISTSGMIAVPTNGGLTSTGNLLINNSGTLTVQGTGTLVVSRGDLDIAATSGDLTATAFDDIVLGADTGDLQFTANVNTIITSNTGDITLNADSGSTIISAGGADDFEFTSLTLDMPVSGVIQFPLEGTIQGVGQITIQNSSTLRYNGGGSVQIGGPFGISPMNSGTNSSGFSDTPWGSTYSNQYATTFKNQTGGNLVVDWNAGSTQKLNFVGVASGTYTVGFSNGIPGSAYVLTTLQNNTGTISVNWSGSQVAWQGGVSGTLTSASGTTDLLSFVCDSSNHYLGTFSNNYF